MNNSNFVLQTTRPFIESTKTYVLDRKLVSIHSGDRDFNKWPNSNQFGVDLGANFNNIQSMRLINFSIPVNHYTFSDSYQNTKLSFTYQANFPIILRDISNSSTPFTTSGQYNIPRAIMKALFGKYLNNKPTDVKIQYDNSQNIWSDFSGDLGDTYYNNGEYATATERHFRIVWNPKKITITIPEGSYTPNNLCQTLQTLMNKEIYNASVESGKYDFIPGYSTGTSFPSPDISNVILDSSSVSSHWYRNRGKGLNPFVVYYNEVTNKIMFGVNNGSFVLHCGEKENYTLACEGNKHIFEQHVKWGFSSYLGFQKKDYSSNIIDVSTDVDEISGDLYQSNVIRGLALPFEENNPWLEGGATTLDISGSTSTDITSWGGVKGNILAGNTESQSSRTLNVKPAIKNLVSTVEAEYNLNIHGEDALYMEVEKYNNIDEMYPYSQRTNNLYNNDLAHRTNGSFAIIPLNNLPFGQESGNVNNFVLNVFHTDPPIKKIDRLKFKFRYHDGRLVDFKNLPFNFTLEFNMLKDEQDRVKRIRVPQYYNL
tara:strand:- start:153 stop:1775 length:1623 start_codon:yes stop_codon:yes gene_type:complete